MASGCLRHTDLPHTSRLFSDFVYHFDRVSQFYAHNPLDFHSYERAAARIDFPPERRAALVDALHAQNGPSPELTKLAEPGTVAVVTGQQVGLFSGPCYTIYKALTAAKLAATLTERGIPAVAIFWLATEDHDFAEVNHAYTLSANHQLVRHEVPSPAADHTPVGGLAVSDYPVDQLAAVLDGLPYADDVMAAVRASYEPGAPLGQAFMALLKRLLSGYPLLYLDPLHPAIRQIAAPLLARAVEQSAELSARLLARNTELEAAGYHAQVHFEAKTSLFFLLQDGQRLTLHRDGDDYILGETRLTPVQLAAQGAALSPNALLRPVVQDYLLPTVAQVGGPAELAYLAQSEVLYDALNRPAPVIVPRSGFTLVDARTAKLLKRYGLSVKDCLDSLDGLNARIAQRLVPEGLARSLESSREMTTTMFDRLVEEVAAFDKTLGEAAAKSRAKVLYQIGKIEAKTALQALRHNERAATEATYLFYSLYPEKHLQERLYTILPFLARHGLDLADRLYADVHIDCPDHIVVEV